METELLTTGELAARWRTTPGRLSNLRSAGTGPAYVKIGQRVLYRLADVSAFESANRVSL